jgi:hypothetical protein
MADDINLAEYMTGSDWLGIGLSVVAAFFIGFVWFTFLFGKQWAKEFGMDTAEKPPAKSMLGPMAKDLLGALLTAYVLWHSIVSFVPSIWADHLSGVAGNAAVAAEDAAMWTYGFWGALFIWLGYFVPVSLSRTGWERRSWSWFGIDVGYHFVKLVAMGQILAAFASGA